ncbi:SubName: Full=Related to metal homeostasis protein {ECO:0000313/EMBL:CCA71227.1} [Serendipita indica DSM 11827]|nr:SubName: Full=Related to metal homeostasis protein {ECO:0000313/EMBL:CCA71227.1} [Serendipita indica DSM 11827]
MPRRQYAAVPAQDTDEDQLEQAFAASDDEHDEHDGNNAARPLLTPSVYGPRSSHTPRTTRTTVDGSYNFEYDYPPPPGSPPREFAIANHWGNTNGILVTEPVHYDPKRQGNWFTRTWRSVTGRGRRGTPPVGTYGGGINNDGVFANISSRPTGTRSQQRAGENRAENETDTIYHAPELAPNDAPPSYLASQMDQAPPYWQTTVFATSDGELLIESIPAGTIVGFLGAFIVSVFLEWIGFALAYIISMTHAGRFGAKAGLGVTFVRLGLWFRTRGGLLDSKDIPDEIFWPLPNATFPLPTFNATTPFPGFNATAEWNTTATAAPGPWHFYWNSTASMHGGKYQKPAFPFADFLALFLANDHWLVHLHDLYPWLLASQAAPTEGQQQESELLSNLQATLTRPTLPNNPPGRTPTSARPLSHQQTAPSTRTHEGEDMIRQDERVRRDLSNQGYI